MKKMLLALMLTLSSTIAIAGPRHHGGHHHHNHGGYRWVAPAIIGGVIGYSITRPYYYNYGAPVYTAPPVYIEQSPAYIQGPQCSPWVETQQPDGTILRSRTCNQ